MHPDDVHELVAAQVENLKLDALGSNLPITDIALEHAVNLYVSFELTHYQPSPIPIVDGNPLLGAGLVGLGTVPDLAVRPTILQRILLFDFSDWDSQPPTAELLDASRTPLPVAQWPQKLTRRGIVDGHPNHARPFFCRPGLREFHTHPQHEDEPWDAIRGGGVTLSALVLGLVSEIVSESLV